MSLVRTQGPYDRAKSHTNRNEAEAVAQWIVEALRDPGRRDRSIGVVTFNMQQQTLIEDLLDQAIKKHPEIEAYFDDRAPEPVFVKNLENVQGDERDVMLFSITYGPDADGRVYMNFGPLNRSGGERRLNVAVTRARERLVVFSSLDPEQIDLRRTLAKGAEHLKAFLRYAAEGQRSLAGGARSGAKSGAGGLEKDIQSTLEARGYAVAAAVGCSAYRMDVGVKSKDDADRFVLGIETDGAAYYGAATVRERERLRSAVLRGLGWTVERVWSFDWWHDRDGALARLETKIAAAAAAPTLPRGPGANEKLVVPSSTASDEPTPAAIESKGVAAKKAPADEVAVYARYRHPATSSPEVLLDVKRTAEHVELLRVVVGVEGPIHRDLLFERLARAFDVGRLTARYEDRLVAFLDEAVRREHVQVLDEFVWGSDADPAAYSLIRGRVENGEEARELEYVPPQEMAAAIRRVLAESIALPRPDLARAAVALFGFKRLTVKAQSSVERGLNLLFERGHCRNEGDRVRLA